MSRRSKLYSAIVVGSLAFHAALPANLSAQSEEILTLERARKLAPGYAVHCRAEIAAAMPYAGSNGVPLAKDITNLNYMAGNIRSEIQHLWQFEANALKGPLNDYGRSIMPWFECAHRYILDHWDEKSSVSAPPPRTTAPPASKTAPPANRRTELWARAKALIDGGNMLAAVPVLEESLRMGDARAPYVLARIYAAGIPGLERDILRALVLMRQSAVMGRPEAIRDLPKLEELAKKSSLPMGVVPAVAGMVPEVAKAYNETTDPAIRARIARKAAEYAASRPSLVVRANVGSNCIRAAMINYEFDATREIWRAETRFKNTCRTDEIVFVEDQMRNSGNAAMPITNVGRFFGKWDRRRDPNVGFKPYNLDGEIPRYRLAASAELTSVGGFYFNNPNNLLELWIGSCPARSTADIAQVAFRPAANLRDDPRIACVQGIQGAKEF